MPPRPLLLTLGKVLQTYFQPQPLVMCAAIPFTRYSASSEPVPSTRWSSQETGKQTDFRVGTKDQSNFLVRASHEND